MRVAQCYTDKQTNKILVIALRTELCGVQSSVRSAITNILQQKVIRSVFEDKCEHRTRKISVFV